MAYIQRYSPLAIYTFAGQLLEVRAAVQNGHLSDADRREALALAADLEASIYDLEHAPKSHKSEVVHA